MKRLALLALSGITFLSSAEAFFPKNSFELFVAPRQDKLLLDIQATDNIGGSQTASYLCDNVRIIEGGARLVLAPDDHWVLRAMVDYGKVCSGNATFSELNTLGRGVTVSGGLSGQVYDASCGMGYLFPIACRWGVMPSFNWSVHRQQFYTTNTTVDSVPTNYRKIVGIWGGPSLGIDLVYKVGCLWAEAGYEAGLMYCRESIFQPQTDEQRVSAHNRYNFSNLFHIRGEWRFRRCLTVALTGAYEVVFGSRNASVSPGSIPDLFTNAKISKVQWNSGSIALSLGLLF